MVDNRVDANKSETLLAANYVPRSRVDRIFEKAAKGKLIHVIAGAGYGKTQAVRHFIEQQGGAVVRWLQLTDSDNICSRYWDNLIHCVSYDNPDLAVKLRGFGFPETLARFKQFAEILRTSEHSAVKTFLVLDDFHLIHSEQALTFAERCAYLQIPGACVIIISRREPEINTVSLFSKGQVSIITEDDLRFTDNEISDYLKQRGIPFSAKNLPLLMDATKGWALAVQLLSMVLMRIPANLDLALDTMKQNVFKLMEIEAWGDFPEHIQKLLVKLSLASDLPLTVLQSYFQGTSILQEAPQLASFVWFDSITGADRVHPLYWDFLRSKQGILSEEDVIDAYRRAAQWCSENSFCLDSLMFLAKSKDYEGMVELLFSYPFKLPPDTCEFFLDVIDDIVQPSANAAPLSAAETDESNGDINLLLLTEFFVPLLLLGAGRYEEAEKRTLEIIGKWERLDTPVALRLLYASYSNLVYIDMYLCTVTHKYNSPMYIKKSREYYNRCHLQPQKVAGSFSVADVRSMACLVGEDADLSEFDEFIDATKQTAIFIAETYHSMYSGYEDLVLCEFAFYRNQPDVATNHAHQAIMKAREKKQYSIEAMASHYLLRIALQQGDYPMAREVLKQLRAHLDNPDFWNAQLLYDLFTGYFYVQIGLPKMIPSWLVMDAKEANSEVHIPTRELLVCAKSHIASKRYSQALAVLDNSYPREPHERFLLSELALSLMTAVARLNTGDVNGAMRDFQKAYAQSQGGVFEMPFIELGKNLRPLIAAASEQSDIDIPSEWLKAIDRKASVYAKKTTVIMNSFKGEQKISDDVQLSAREQEVLSDLYHGLSRDEIAEHRYLSVNTVKKILQSIYIKLDANNNVDAIRIALERKLIES